MEENNKLIISDPETNTEYTICLNDEDYERASSDDIYVSSLLEHAKQSEVEFVEPEVSEVEAESQSLLSPIFLHRKPKNVENDEDLLISLIQVRPAVWDSRLPLMERSKTIKEKLWLEIYDNFKENPHMTLELLQKKWKNLKDNFIKTKLEVDTYIPTGSGAQKKKKIWKHFDSLKFLSDTIAPRKTYCSIVELKPSPSKEAQGQEVKSQTKKRKIIKEQVESCEPEDKFLKAVKQIVDTPENPPNGQINPICLKISDLLQRMPLKERTSAEIQLLQKALYLSENFI